MTGSAVPFWHSPRLPWLEILEDGRKVRLRLIADPAVQGGLVEFGDRYARSFARAPLLLTGRARRSFWQAEIPNPTRRLRYRFRIDAGMGGLSILGPHWGADWFELPYAYPPKPPGPWPGTTVYAIFPDRFAEDPGLPPKDLSHPQDLYGGTLRGIVHRLDYLEVLGIGAVYLNPIHPSTSYHRYDVENAWAVDPRLGTLDDFRTLSSELHARGMRLILDMVFNHTSNRHPWFQEALKNASSPHRKAFRIAEDGTYETFATNVPSLPKLIWTPAVEREVGDVLGHWTRLGVDGFRLDVANEMPHEGWLRLRDRFPDALLWGEVFPPAPEWVEDRPYTGVTDYVWQSQVGEAVLKGQSAGRIAQGILEHDALYSARQHSANWRVLGSHDLPRAMTTAGGVRRRVEMAQALAWTSPGLPVLYYGDEQYMEGGPDPDCRRPFPWEMALDDPKEGFLRRLIGLRLNHPWMSRLPLLKVAVHQGLVGVVRGSAGPSLVTVLAPRQRGGTFPLPDGLWRDPLSGETFERRVPLKEPMPARILMTEPNAQRLEEELGHEHAPR